MFHLMNRPIHHSSQTMKYTIWQQNEMKFKKMQQKWINLENILLSDFQLWRPPTRYYKNIFIWNVQDKEINRQKVNLIAKEFQAEF